jgi:hypothetical protein
MRLRLGSVLATTVTMVFGLITLLGLLIGNDVGPLSAMVNSFRIRDLTSIFLQLAAITVALTVLLGILNLMIVHINRVVRRRKGALYSVVLILSFVLVIGTYFVQRDISLMLLDTVQVSIESALAALVLFSLVFGAATLLRRRTSLAGILFLIVVLTILLGALPIEGLDRLAVVRDWLNAVPVNAGVRGILIGIGLATLVAGVRVLIGQDRSFRE